ncbi:uncharacterized protein MYCFIDRAFT_178454 [Pseudocercospora fijiensis CIRAD86]|uniref:Uncharacterized protein n=1 Tax=Pseudocercospora fijiensis (strain CIRAD86) TaxID=383855 RepID=M3A1Q0_PSEFD|nr:uncharacterized protein MYCFIDRAFT_178454 [Pseudocercospora fijiensis CIRAD86]EME78296.1 hypothetical protein MYCFIDRAFT_178454 [Pseudocercospora fijiensis CIRAD86]
MHVGRLHLGTLLTRESSADRPRILPLLGLTIDQRQNGMDCIVFQWMHIFWAVLYRMSAARYLKVPRQSCSRNDGGDASVHTRGSIWLAIFADENERRATNATCRLGRGRYEIAANTDKRVWLKRPLALLAWAMFTLITAMLFWTLVVILLEVGTPGHSAPPPPPRDHDFIWFMRGACAAGTGTARWSPAVVCPDFKAYYSQDMIHVSSFLTTPHHTISSDVLRNWFDERHCLILRKMFVSRKITIYSLLLLKSRLGDDPRKNFPKTTSSCPIRRGA